ncbi:MAG: hypothetical protein ACKO4Z_00365 [Planctomycetota bacterium]
MATATRSTSDPLAVPAWEPDDSASKSERYIGRRLTEASAEVKGIALTTFFLGAAVAGVSWLLLGVLVEHWLVAGGLPRWARWIWMTVAIAAAVAAAIRWVLPLIRYRVNLVYAARAIEREHPELHNDVVNAVLARARPDESTPLVLRSLRRRAAAQLKRVGHDGVVDYTLPLRLAAILASLVVAAVIYELVAPKSLLLSTVRLVAPWAGIAAPARTRIDPPRLQWRQPGKPAAAPAQELAVVQGATTMVRGRQLVVTTSIRNLRQGERPLAIVTPRRATGAAASWRVPLAPKKDGGFEAVLPDAARGLDESIDLVVAAGDAQTEPVRVKVVDAPTIVIREVTYAYPKYTGLEERTVEWQGDLSAIEGTVVKLVAETNQPVDLAWVDFGGDGKGDVPLKPGQRDLARVRGEFTLDLNADRSGAEHHTYRLMFKPKAAASGARSDVVVDQLEHRIDVTPDLAPEVSIVVPEQKVVRVPPDAAVTVRVRAADPDFGLASVVVETMIKDGPVVQGPNLITAKGSQDRRKRFEGDAKLLPARLGAREGTVLQYRAVVTDTRPKEPNVTATAWQSLVIDQAALPQAEPPPRTGQTGAADDGSGEDGPASGAGGGGRGDEPVDANEAGEAADSGESRGDARDQRETAAQPPPQERKGGEKRPSGAAGEQDRQQPKSRQNDPKPAQDEGAPEQGEDRGSADGGKPQDGMKGKSGDQAGQRQQDGSSDGAGGQPQGQGGAGQSGDQDGQGPEGAGGKTPQQPGAGGREQKPGDSARGGRANDSARGGGREERQRGQRSGNERGQGGARERVASDGTADGEAMEKILEHRRREQADGEAGRESGKQSGPSESGSRQQADAKQPGERADSEKKPAGGPPDAKDQAKSDRDGQSESRPPCASPDGKPCGKPGCPSCNGGVGAGSQGGGAAEGPADSVAKEGQPGSGGAKPGGQAGTGGKPGSTAGSDRGDGADGGDAQSREVAGRGESGEAGGAKQQGEQAGDTGGRQPGAGDTAEPAPGRGEPGRQGKPGAAGSEQAGNAAVERPAGEGPGPEGLGSEASGSEASGSTGAKPGGEEIADGAGTENSAPGTEPSATDAGGGAVGGGQGQQAGTGTGERQDRPVEWTEQDLSHARNAADLALEHLRRSVDSGDRAVLDELGWTPDQAREFLARWERMRAAAGGERRPPREFDEAVKSLGLRPEGVRRSRDLPADVRGGQAEGRRSRPPSDYREQFRAFLQGAAVE